MEHLLPLIRRHIDQAHADGAEHLDLSLPGSGISLLALLDR